MRVNKKMRDMPGNIVKLKDITNIAAAMKSGHTRNDLDATVSILTNKYGKHW